jgi:hypothetical protein
VADDGEPRLVVSDEMKSAFHPGAVGDADFEVGEEGKGVEVGRERVVLGLIVAHGADYLVDGDDNVGRLPPALRFFDEGSESWLSESI